MNKNPEPRSKPKGLTHIDSGYITDPNRYPNNVINRALQIEISTIMEQLRDNDAYKWDFTGDALMKDVLWGSDFMKDINCWEDGSCNDDDCQFTSLPAELDYRYVVGIRPTGIMEKLNYFMFKGEKDGDGFISAESQSLYGRPNHPDEKTRVLERPGLNHNSELTDYIGLLDAMGIYTWRVVAKCPVDIAVESPSGLIQTKDHAEILGARYMEADIDGDGELDKMIEIPFPEQGEYKVTVTPEEGADPTETYSLEITQGDNTTVIKEDAPISELNGEPEIIHVNAMPIADAGPDQSLVADISGNATATLNGSNSSDAGSSEGTNDDIVSFEWFENDTLLATGEVILY